MNDPSTDASANAQPDASGVAEKLGKRGRSKSKPKPVAAVKAKIELTVFRELLDRVLENQGVLGNEQVRFLRQTLEALREDTGGTIRITLTPPTGPTRPPTRKFSRSAVHTDTIPGDEELRVLTREIALMTDEQEAFTRIDSLPVETLQRGARLFGFRADTLVGLKAAFAEVVADIRQMENIATKKPQEAEPTPAPPEAGGEPPSVNPQPSKDTLPPASF